MKPCFHDLITLSTEKVGQHGCKPAMDSSTRVSSLCYLPDTGAA